MKILRFDTDAPKDYPGFKLYQKEEKIKNLDGIDYYKLGTQTARRNVGWKIKNLFQTIGLALLFPALCSKQHRKLIHRSWKNFKSGGETVSIYVRKQIHIPKLSISVPKIEPEKPSCERLVLPSLRFVDTISVRIVCDRNKDKTRLIDELGKATTAELESLVELSWRDLLVLFSLRDKISFSAELQNKFRNKVIEHLENEPILPTLSKEEWKSLNQLTPFHPRLIKEINFLHESNFWIIESVFDHSFNDIPVEFLTNFLSALSKNFARFAPSDPIIQLIVRSYQADFNTTSDDVLSELILLFERLQVRLPNIENLSNEKIIELVRKFKTFEVKEYLYASINQIGKIQDIEQRKIKLPVLFSELDASEIFQYLSNERKERLKSASLNVLYGCTDTHNEKDQRSLDGLLDLLLSRHNENVQEIRNEIAKEATLNQALYLIDSQSFASSGLSKAEIITNAILKDVKGLVEALPSYQLYWLYLELPLSDARKILVKEVVHQLKIESFVEREFCYKEIFSEVTVDPLNSYVNKLATADNLREIDHFFQALASYEMTLLFNITANITAEEESKFLACYDEFGKKHPDKILSSYNGFIYALEKSVEKLNDYSQVVTQRMLDQTKKNFPILDKLRNRLGIHANTINSYLKNLSEQMLTISKEDFSNWNLFRIMVAVREKGIFSEEELKHLSDHLIDFHAYHKLANAFAIMNLDNQKYLIRQLIEKYNNLPPADSRTINPSRTIFDAIREIKSILSSEEIARLELDPSTHDLSKFAYSTN